MFTPGNLAALIIAASFSAGLNAYATILTLGLLAHSKWVALPPGLEMLGHWWVIGGSALLFALEFVADKIPVLDLVWNALHTVIRIPVAALLAYHASEHLNPRMQALAVVGGAAIATITHGSKLAARASVTPSPEPVSNIVLSGTEDVMAIGLTWLATRHPWVSAGIALTLLASAIVAVRWTIKRLRTFLGRISKQYRNTGRSLSAADDPGGAG